MHNKRKFLFLCKGVVGVEVLASIIQDFIQIIGMTPARMPEIFSRSDEYPFKGGGGFGLTGIWGFFPLMESYIIVDSYTDLRETEVLLSTCKPDRMCLSTATDFLSTHIGPAKLVGTL